MPLDQEQGNAFNQRAFSSPQPLEQASPRRPIHSNLVSHALAGALDLTPLPFYLCNLYAKDVMKAWTDNALKFYTIYKLRGSLPIAVKQSCVYPPRRSVNSQEPWSKKKLGNTIKPSGLPSLEWLL
jgi:hypothetical protein